MEAVVAGLIAAQNAPGAVAHAREIIDILLAVNKDFAWIMCENLPVQLAAQAPEVLRYLVDWPGGVFLGSGWAPATLMSAIMSRQTESRDFLLAHGTGVCDEAPVGLVRGFRSGERMPFFAAILAEDLVVLRKQRAAREEAMAAGKEHPCRSIDLEIRGLTKAVCSNKKRSAEFLLDGVKLPSPGLRFAFAEAIMCGSRDGDDSIVRKIVELGGYVSPDEIGKIARHETRERLCEFYRSGRLKWDATDAATIERECRK
jgi:hypothetical protein